MRHEKFTPKVGAFAPSSGIMRVLVVSMGVFSGDVHFFESSIKHTPLRLEQA